MAVRRTIYLITLIASFLLYLFHTQYLSFVLMEVVVFVPIASCLLTLPLLRKYRLGLKWHTDPDNRHAAPVISVHTGQVFPVTPMHMEIELDNLYYQERQRRSVTMVPGQKAIPAVRYLQTRYGVIRGSVKKARMQDFLGLVRFPVPCGTPVEVLFLPDEIPFSGSGLLEKSLEKPLSEEVSDARFRGVGDREQKDIRGFREGDALRDVHWKLTMRSDEMIVREYEPDGEQLVDIRLERAADPDQFARCIGRFLGLVRYLEEARQPYRVLQEGEEAIWRPREQREMLWRFLSKPPAHSDPGEDFPLETEKQLLFQVSSEEISLYVDGEEREVFS